jgi:hypothetical protein
MTPEEKKQYQRDYYHRKIKQSGLSDFARFYINCLGLEVRQISTGKILSKGEYYEKVQQFCRDFVLVPYSPLDGWRNSEEIKRHEAEVAMIKKHLVYGTNH